MDAQTTNNVITGLGVAIAIFAFFVSALTLRSQRKHNELSARPIIDASFGRDENLLELTNCGLGPALIQSVTAQIEGHELDLMTDRGLAKLADLLVRIIGRNASVTPLKLTSQTPLMPSQSKPILTLRAPFSVQELDSIRTRLCLISLTVEYKCIYNKLHKFEHSSEQAAK